MSRLDANDGDYVLIYDGENGLRMAPRAMAAALQDQETGEPDGIPPDNAPNETATEGGRGRQVLAVIGVVAGLGLLGFMVGHHWATARTPAAPPRLARVAETPAPPALATSIPAAAGAKPATEHRPRPTVEKAAVHKRTMHKRTIQSAAVAPKRTTAAEACGPARSWAEWLVCHDPGLSAQDARLGQALKAANDAGAPSQDLKDGQAVWVARRNAAARRSRTEVSAAYRERIEEVERLAKETPPF